MDAAVLDFYILSDYAISEMRIAGRQDVNASLNRLPVLEGRQSDIHLNAYTCLPAFSEFDASCAIEDFLALELRWMPRRISEPVHLTSRRFC